MDSTDRLMTLRDYLAVVRRRLWIVAAAVVIATSVGVGLSVSQTPIYRANAQMLVSTRATDSLFNTGVDLRGADATRAVQTEIRVLEGERVRERVRDDLDLERLPPPVDGSLVGSTDVISVTVRSEDPETARNLANAYVQAYINNRREEAVNDLLAASVQVQTKIDEIQAQVDSLPDGDPQRSSLVSQQNAFRQTLNQLQVDTALKTGGATVVKSARLPVNPIEPTPTRTALMAAAAGLLLGLAAAFAIEYFDDSIRSEDDLDRLSPLPVLAVVPIDPPIDNRPVALSAPADFAVETYRGLRTNLQFLSLDRPIKVIQVTSSLPGEGKTTTATNLACVLAQAGRSVAIVDADLRRPRVHEVFGTPSSPGVTELLVGEPLANVAQPLRIGADKVLAVVSSGTVPGNPGELLSSQRCRDMIDQVAEHFDYVIVDSAPVLPVADSIALTGAVDAVLFVTQAKHTSRRNVSEALERLERVHAPVVGLVLNQAGSGKSGADAYGYGYGYGAGAGDEVSTADAAAGTGSWAHGEADVAAR